MLHLIVGAVLTFGTLYFIVNVIVLAGRLLWLCVLIVAWLAVAAWTALLLVALSVQKLSQVAADWRFRKRYGEILLPPPPD
jgi:hypothetical protein